MSKQQQKYLQSALEESMECEMCHLTDVPLMRCSSCRTVKYCSTACQTAAWVWHRSACNRARKERESLKVNEEGAKEPGSRSGSGSGLRDMKSILAALNIDHSNASAAAEGAKEPGSGSVSDMGSIMLALEAHKDQLLADLNMVVAASAVAEGAKEPGTGSGSDSGSDLQDMGSMIDYLKSASAAASGTAIYNACYLNQHVELQKMLLLNGLEIDWAVPESGSTAAYIAAQRGHEKCLALLISKGANLTKMNKQGQAPIHVACKYGRYSTLNLLLDNGVDASLPTSDDEGEYTPAMISSGLGHVKLLALLLDRGSDPNLTNSLGLAAAHMACATGHVKCLQLLIKRGANINMRRLQGQTPLDVARICKQRECEDLLLLHDAVGMDVANLHFIDDDDKEGGDFGNMIKEMKALRKSARRCDNPACQTSPDDKSNKRPKKCAACEVALYCCAACQTAHWPAHTILCIELR